MIARTFGWLLGAGIATAAITLPGAALLLATNASDQLYAARAHKHAAAMVDCRNAYIAGALIANDQQTTPEFIAAPPAQIATAWANHSSRIRTGNLAGHGIGPCSQPGAAVEQALIGLLTQLGMQS